MPSETPTPSEMQGTRIDYSGDGIPANGAYWRDTRDGNWYGMTPNGHLVGFAKHEVAEHADGTVTVSPSIDALAAWDAPGEHRPRGERRLWHGFLERGVWREC